MSAIRYMARNHVAANIVMFILILGGMVAAFSLTVEVFPDIEFDRVAVTVAYPGAGPEEVEEGIVMPVEEAVQGLEGIKRVDSTASEGGGSVIIEILKGNDLDMLTQDVKAAVDRIRTFPQNTERPVVQKLMRSRSVMSVVVHGDMDMHALRQRGEALRDDLLSLKEVTQADLVGVPPYEIAIEISEENLRRYGLTLGQVAAKVRAASLDLPAGVVKADGGEILLRTKERRYTARQYGEIVVVSKQDGTLVKLKEIATVRDTFAETDQRAYYNGQPAARVNIYRVGDQTPMEISKAVKAFLKRQQEKLPAGMGLSIWSDRSEVLKARMDLLGRNAILGLILVICILGLFLRVRLAFWVTLGIPLSMLGSLILMPVLGVTINMITLFAFIVVLGIVVDDAIVVGENIYTHRTRGLDRQAASEKGALEVAMPVTFSILTTVAAFSPLLFITGIMGKFMIAMPIIVISVLLVSLFESLLVLPAHLAGSKDADPNKPPNIMLRMNIRVERFLDWFIDVPYKRTLHVALQHRYVSMALAIAMVLIVAGLFQGRHIKFIFMPELEGDVVKGQITMPFGTPATTTEVHLRRMLKTARATAAEFNKKEPGGRKVERAIYMITGSQGRRRGPGGGGGGSGGHLGEVAVYLVDSGERVVESQQFARAWRERVGSIAGAEKLSFDARFMNTGEAIDIALGHQDFAVLEAASERLKAALKKYPGVFDVADSQEQGKQELKLKLRPGARAMGISEQELASQVRHAFYGAEALRLLRGRNEVKVMVRYPREERRSLADVQELRIRAPATAAALSSAMAGKLPTPGAREIPFAMAAQVEEGRGYSAIRRAERKRIIRVTARTNMKVANPAEIIEELQGTILAQLMNDYQGLSYDMEGQHRERAESFSSMGYGFMVALFVMYALLAVPFRSYSQPLIIMSAIPFGIIGAVIGHLLLGYNMSLISMMGVVALSGVVVNDSLVLIDFINRNRRGGQSLREAVIEGGKRRFRPIMLTTLTTFFALVPMLAETSVQARFLVPMAISLAFGVAFATQITLVLIPVLYLILEDIRSLARWIWYGTREGQADTKVT